MLYRTARSGQGRAASAGRSGPLTARTVLRRVATRERRSSNSIRFLKRNKRNGCICMATIVLSETPWPIALFGYPRGHRVNNETQCLSTFDAYRKVGYSPSNRALRETRMASSRNDPEVGIGSRYTLKLLVVSVLPDRSVLLSSRSLMQWPRSYAPVSDGPSPAPSRRPTNFGRTLPTDHYRPAWPHS